MVRTVNSYSPLIRRITNCNQQLRSWWRPLSYTVDHDVWSDPFQVTKIGLVVWNLERTADWKSIVLRTSFITLIFIRQFPHLRKRNKYAIGVICHFQMAQLYEIQKFIHAHRSLKTRRIPFLWWNIAASGLWVKHTKNPAWKRNMLGDI